MFTLYINPKCNCKGLFTPNPSCDKVILPLQHNLWHQWRQARDVIDLWLLIGQFPRCHTRITKKSHKTILRVASRAVWMVRIKTACSIFFNLVRCVILQIHLSHLVCCEKAFTVSAPSSIQLIKPDQPLFKPTWLLVCLQSMCWATELQLKLSQLF